jgi:hypothetical protein
MRHAILTGPLVGVQFQCPMGPRACSLSLAAHVNHAGVQQPAKGLQLRVDTSAMSLVVLVDILPLTLTNWMDHCPILPALSRWSQERAP